MISVSDIDEMPTCESVAAALASRTPEVTDEGRYRNRKGTLGYYATVKSGEHWYMVSVSDMLQPYHNDGSKELVNQNRTPTRLFSSKSTPKQKLQLRNRA